MKRVAVGRIVKVLLFTTYLLFLLLLLEASYRFALFGWSSFSIARMNSVHSVVNAGITRLASDREVFVELKPGLATYFKLARFETNSEGLRDKEYTKSKPPNTFRVAVVGDSFTMASGVEIEDAYHTLLETRLNEERDDRSHEFINFGVGAYSPRNYWAIMQTKALEVDPDLILIGFCAENDHQIRAPRRPRQNRAGSPPGKNRTSRSPGAKKRAPRITYPFYESFVFKALRAAFGPSRYRIRQGLSTEPIVITEEQQGRLDEYLSKMGTWSQERRIPVVVAYLSNRPRNPAVVEELAVRNGLHFVDVTSSFEGTELEDYIIYSIDGHPNADAHRIFSERIYDYLQEMDLLKGRRSSREATLKARATADRSR